MGFFNIFKSSSSSSSSSSRKSRKSNKSSSRKHSKRDETGADDRPSSSREPHLSRRQSAALSGDDGYDSKPDASATPSFNGNGKSRSFFSTGRSTSYYKRSPRQKLLAHTYKKLKRMLTKLIYWAKRHPMKVVMFVVVPLISSGGLTTLLARFGLRLPIGIERMLEIAAHTAGGTGSIGLMGEAMHLGPPSSNKTRGVVADSKTGAQPGFDSSMIMEKIRSEYAEYTGDKSGDGGLVGKLIKLLA